MASMCVIESGTWSGNLPSIVLSCQVGKHQSARLVAKKVASVGRRQKSAGRQRTYQGGIHGRNSCGLAHRANAVGWPANGTAPLAILCRRRRGTKRDAGGGAAARFATAVEPADSRPGRGTWRGAFRPRREGRAAHGGRARLSHGSPRGGATGGGSGADGEGRGERAARRDPRRLCAVADGGASAARVADFSGGESRGARSASRLVHAGNVAGTAGREAACGAVD